MATEEYDTMFMNFLKRWGPVLMFLVVVGACVAFVLTSLIDPKGDDEVIKALDAKVKVEQALSAGKVSQEYIASSQQAAKIKYSSTLNTAIERIKHASDEQIGTNISYPQPVRPKSEEPPKPIGQNDIVAKMPYLDDSKFSAEEARGKVYIKCELPNDATAYVMMEPVRFEIFRGLSKDKIDTTKPWGTIEVGLEALPAPKAAAVGGAPVAPVAAPEATLSKREREALERSQGKKSDTPNGKGKPAPETPLPPYERFFRDTKDINQLTTYFYQVRLVARFTSVDQRKEPGKQADGTPIEIIHHKPNDKNLTPVASNNPGTVLYATPLTKPVSATTPTNFQLRMSGIKGDVPPVGTIRNPANHNNPKVQVNFEVSVWIADTGNWERLSVNDVREGDMISGKVKYTTKGGEKKEYDFTKDLGYKLYEVNSEEVESASKGIKTTIEVALLENQRIKERKEALEKNPATKVEAAKLEPIERFLKSGRSTLEKESAQRADQVIEAQEREIKKLLAAPPPVAPPSTPAPAAPGTVPPPPGVPILRGQ